MALIRCTCIYRAAPNAGDDVLAVEVAAADPWCPSAHLHGKVQSPAMDEVDPAT